MDKMPVIQEDASDLLESGLVVQEDEIDFKKSVVQQGTFEEFDPKKYPALFASVMNQDDLAQVQQQEAFNSLKQAKLQTNPKYKKQHSDTMQTEKERVKQQFSRLQQLFINTKQNIMQQTKKALILQNLTQRTQEQKDKLKRYKLQLQELFQVKSQTKKLLIANYTKLQQKKQVMITCYKCKTVNTLSKDKYKKFICGKCQSMNVIKEVKQDKFQCGACKKTNLYSAGLSTYVRCKCGVINRLPIKKETLKKAYYQPQKQLTPQKLQNPSKQYKQQKMLQQQQMMQQKKYELIKAQQAQQILALKKVQQHNKDRKHVVDYQLQKQLTPQKLQQYKQQKMLQQQQIMQQKKYELIKAQQAQQILAFQKQAYLQQQKQYQPLIQQKYQQLQQPQQQQKQGGYYNTPNKSQASRQQYQKK